MAFRNFVDTLSSSNQSQKKKMNFQIAYIIGHTSIFRQFSLRELNLTLIEHYSNSIDLSMMGIC